MTCIVGFVNNGKVYIGGDSAGVAGLELRLREDKKVFRKGNMVFGFTSSFRMGQILRYCFSPPDHDTKKSDFEYLCSDFIDALVSVFKDKGYAKVDNNQVSGGVFLVGYKGRLYQIESDFQVGEITNNYNACGCGGEYALGALKASENREMKPRKRVVMALGVAEHFSAGVSSPFCVVSI